MLSPSLTVRRGGSGCVLPYHPGWPTPDQRSRGAGGPRWRSPLAHTRDHHDTTPITDEGVEHPAHDADEPRPEERRPEAVDLEALHELGGEPEAERVEDEEEEPEAHQRDRQGEHHEDRADDRVDQPEHEAGDERRPDASDRDPGHDVGDEVCRERVDEDAEPEYQAEGIMAYYRF